MPRPIRAFLTAAALLAVGCGSGFDEERETVRPLKVAHALGESKVPGQGQRPLALTDGALDAMLALEDRPIGALLPGGNAPRYLRRARVEVQEPLIAAGIPAVEALDPDVILGSKRQAHFYGRLSKVAPTVMSEGGLAANWKLDLRLFGEALGRTNDAEALLSDWDEAAAKARRRLRSAAGTRVAVVRVVRSGLRVARPESFAGKVLSDAGLEPAGERQAADVILVSHAPGMRTSLARLGLRKAVRVDDRLWWEGDGLLAARAALSDIERFLAG